MNRLETYLNDTPYQIIEKVNDILKDIGYEFVIVEKLDDGLAYELEAQLMTPPAGLDLSLRNRQEPLE